MEEEEKKKRKTVRDHLVDALENLEERELKKFTHKLNEFPVRAGFSNIPRGLLEKADAFDLSRLLINYYKEDYAVQVAIGVLDSINLKDQAKALSEALAEKGKQLQISQEKHFIDQHRDGLIQRVVTVEPVLDRLYGTVLNDEEYHNICSKGTSYDKMRELYRLVHSWNSSQKDKLHEALKEKNPYLVDELERR